MSGLLADPGSSQARPGRRVKLGSGAPESLRAETRAAWSEPHSGQAVPGSAAGWQCAIQDHDSLLISTVGVPTGVEWKLEVQDERWDRPFFTKCTEPNTALRLGRGTKHSPAPTEPVRVRMRLGLVGARDALGSAGAKEAGWSEWVTLAADGGATQFIPLGFEEMRPAFDRFNKGRAPAGHATYKELQAMLRSVGVDPTTKAAATALAAHQVGPAALTLALALTLGLALTLALALPQAWPRPQFRPLAGGPEGRQRGHGGGRLRHPRDPTA